MTSIKDASTETAIIFGEAYRHRGWWQIRAVDRRYRAELQGIELDLRSTSHNAV
ncbi:TerD family protein [Streptomyces chartreusis]